MTTMIKSDDIPDDVVVALRAALEKSEYLDAAIAAAINAWPGMIVGNSLFDGEPMAFIPLPQEVSDD